MYTYFNKKSFSPLPPRRLQTIRSKEIDPDLDETLDDRVSFLDDLPTQPLSRSPSPSLPNSPSYYEDDRPTQPLEPMPSPAPLLDWLEDMPTQPLEDANTSPRRVSPFENLDEYPTQPLHFMSSPSHEVDLSELPTQKIPSPLPTPRISISSSVSASSSSSSGNSSTVRSRRRRYRRNSLTPLRWIANSTRRSSNSPSSSPSLSPNGKRVREIVDNKKSPDPKKVRSHETVGVEKELETQREKEEEISQELPNLFSVFTSQNGDEPDTLQTEFELSSRSPTPSPQFETASPVVQRLVLLLQSKPVQKVTLKKIFNDKKKPPEKENLAPASPSDLGQAQPQSTSTQTNSSRQTQAARLLSSPLPLRADRVRTLTTTSLNSQERDEIERLARTLGSVRFDEDMKYRATHLIVGSQRRTHKLLIGIARGCWLMKTDWVIKSFDEGGWLDETEHQIPDHWFPGYQPSRLAHMSGRYNLLKGITIYINPSIPSYEMVKRLIHLTGAKYTKFPKLCNLCVVVQGHQLPPYILENEHIPAVRIEWLFDSVASFEKKKLDDYWVFRD
eukprot:TRINITY_DN15396_c0_g1_i1.p1 TRINITY_DN15396_c0_g1~~TRINITY_DN15396_c0_g1_i1.p1  ORF type:complete len:559 (-),score=99.13 TRINITY_DN15396_c0_g1_i1:73-1749(-)